MLLPKGFRPLLHIAQCCTFILQGNNSLPQGLKASMLGAMRTEAPRKVAVAYDALEAGRQMLAWAARFCLQRNDELHLVQYNKVGQVHHDIYGGATTWQRVLTLEGKRCLLRLGILKRRTKGQGLCHASREDKTPMLCAVCVRHSWAVCLCLQ